VSGLKNVAPMIASDISSSTSVNLAYFDDTATCHDREC